MKTNRKYQLTALALFTSCIFSAQAAKVDSTLSWENVRYGTSGDYTGFRIDTTINPDNSNWYFSLGWKQSRTKGDEIINNNQRIKVGVKDSQRLDFKIAYRYRLDNSAWVQPAIGYRQDLYLQPYGRTDRSEYYLFEVVHNYPITEQLASVGWIKLQFNPSEQITYNVPIRNARQTERDENITWEVEQGLNYAFSPKFNVTVALNDTGNRQEQDDYINSSITKRDLQFRLYANYTTDFGLQFAPYLRKTIFGEAKEWNQSRSYYLNKNTTRYAMRVSYPLNKNISLVGEYYKEKVKKSVGKDSTQKYAKLGLRVTF